MQYANPLYDHAFKYLMLNNKLAIKVLSTIIGKAVVSLQLEQQETVVESKILNFEVFHLDFKATIQHEDGRREQVLIELQKSKKTGDIQRFRKYIGSSYMQVIERSEHDNTSMVQPLPIFVVYILGFSLPEIKALAVKIGQKAVNLSTGKTMTFQSDFVDSLMHSCFIIQLKRLPKKRLTDIEKLLSIFDQDFADQEHKYIMNKDDSAIPKEFLDMVKHLQKPLKDLDYKRKLELEQDLDNLLLFQEKELEYTRKCLEKVSDEVDKVTVEKEEIIRQKEEANRQKEEANRQKEEADKLLKSAIQALIAQGLSETAIIGILNISPEKLKLVLSI